MTAQDLALLARAAAWPDHRCWRELTPDALRDIAARDGCDYATAVLHDRLVRSREHGPFIRRVAACSAAGPPPPGALFAIVPGACYREYPQTGADGRRLYDHMHRQGWTVAVVPVATFGSLASNARTICGWLRERTERTIVLVSLSKGGADVRTALAMPDAPMAFCRVAAWVSLSGIIHGTVLANCFLRRRVLRTVARLLCWRHGYPFATLAELERRAGGPLDSALVLPQSLRAVHVVGLPLTCHLRSHRARRGHRWAASLGPSDGGGVLLGDLHRLPGWIYPVLGADHYLESDDDLCPLVGRIVHVALGPWAERTADEDSAALAGR